MAFLTAPWRTVFEAFAFERQPFLSGILPRWEIAPAGSAGNPEMKQPSYPQNQ